MPKVNKGFYNEYQYHCLPSMVEVMQCSTVSFKPHVHSTKKINKSEIISKW